MSKKLRARRGLSAGASSSDDAPKKEKFDFKTMKDAATSDKPAVRKQAFVDYFERFAEFPSYLFDNQKQIDERLLATIRDLLKDPETTKEMHKGIQALMGRLPSESA